MPFCSVTLTLYPCPCPLPLDVGYTYDLLKPNAWSKSDDVWLSDPTLKRPCNFHYGPLEANHHVKGAWSKLMNDEAKREMDLMEENQDVPANCQALRPQIFEWSHDKSSSWINIT